MQGGYGNSICCIYHACVRYIDPRQLYDILLYSHYNCLDFARKKWNSLTTAKIRSVLAVLGAPKMQPQITKLLWVQLCVFLPYFLFIVGIIVSVCINWARYKGIVFEAIYSYAARVKNIGYACTHT